MEEEHDPYAPPDYDDMITDERAVASRASVNDDMALSSYADFEGSDEEEADGGYTPIDLTEIARREMERLGVDHGMFLSWRNLSYYTENVRRASQPSASPCSRRSRR